VGICSDGFGSSIEFIKELSVLIVLIPKSECERKSLRIMHPQNNRTGPLLIPRQPEESKILTWIKRSFNRKERGERKVDLT